MSNAVSQSLNKGVPVWAPVTIRSGELFDIFSDSENLKTLINTSFYKNYIDYLVGICGREIDLNIFQTMCIDIDEKTLERKLIFSPSSFFSSLAVNLNCQDICRKGLNQPFEFLSGAVCTIGDHARLIFDDRLRLLSTIKKPNELKKEFPLLYKYYQRREEDNKNLRTAYVRLCKMSKEARQKHIDVWNETNGKNIPGYSIEGVIREALSFTFDKFVSEYSLALNNLVDNAGDIVRHLMASPIDLDSLGEVDKDKLELYFAHRFMVDAEYKGQDNVQDYLYYVCNYFAEHKDVLNSSLSITVDRIDNPDLSFLVNCNKEGVVVTPQSLYDRYCKILIDNPNLRAIDFSHLDFAGLTVSEVKRFMDEYLKDLSAQWDFLPPDNRTYEEDVLRRIRTAGEGMSAEERELHQCRLLDLFLEKKNLYDSSDPFFRVKGKNTFDGYIGFIYPNGRVVLDKFYDDSDGGVLADGHAVYAMGIQDFYTLSKLSKSEIIRNKLCNRYIHKGAWADRVLTNEINAAGIGDVSVEVKKLFKSGDVVQPQDSVV